jgi:AraC family transcriptional regulator
LSHPRKIANSASASAVEHHGEVLARFRGTSATVTDLRYGAALTTEAHQHERPVFGIAMVGRVDECFGASKFDCVPGTILYCPPGEVHADRVERGARVIAIDFDPDILRGLSAPALQPQIRRTDLATTIGALLQRQARIDDDVSQLAIEGLTLELAAEFTRASHDVRAPGWLLGLRAMLDESWTERVTLDDAARYAGRHPAHIAREFRHHFHCTIADYVRNLRVEHASQLLRTTERPLAEIALECGFAHQAHFCHVFKTINGMTPAVYRRFWRSSAATTLDS